MVTVWWAGNGFLQGGKSLFYSAQPINLTEVCWVTADIRIMGLDFSHSSGNLGLLVDLLFVTIT